MVLPNFVCHTDSYDDVQNHTKNVPHLKLERVSPHFCPLRQYYSIFFYVIDSYDNIQNHTKNVPYLKLQCVSPHIFAECWYIVMQGYAGVMQAGREILETKLKYYDRCLLKEINCASPFPWHTSALSPSCAPCSS